MAAGIHHQTNLKDFPSRAGHNGGLCVMADTRGASPIPGHTNLAAALQPVLLERCFVEEAVSAAMADEAIAAGTFLLAAWAEIAHRVTPAMREEVAQSQGIHFLSPDAIGVGPGSRWIRGCQASHPNP